MRSFLNRNDDARQVDRPDGRLLSSATLAQIGELRRDCSTEQAIDLRQELGEVEPGRASGTCGVEVRAVPVSLLLRELGIGFAGPAAGAMMLVVGQEAGQIAQPRVSPRGASAPAVAG